MGDNQNDLPLLSNANDILVEHYAFNFVCDIEKKTFFSSVILFLKPIVSEKQHIHRNSHCKSRLMINTLQNPELTSGHSNFLFPNFVLVLDCHKIYVNNVEELNTGEELDSLKFSNSTTISGKVSSLKFLLGEWCLKIWKDDVCCQFCFPKLIKITYTTFPEGSSLLWVHDQNGKPAVFTYGAWINNRSLFPCQEVPSAMATWEAKVSVCEPALVLMSGDAEASISMCNGLTIYYYFTKNALPMSTLALAIGFWKVHKISNQNWDIPSCRIIAPASLLTSCVNIFSEYIKKSVAAAQSYLGDHPFPRIDFLLVPQCFGSLGMASPNLIFLSQSLLCGDKSMCSRISHEISHSWFGLLIGAADWTEEWLSEGFATFMEDHIHMKALDSKQSEERDYCEIKSFLRMLTLKSEVQNTIDELQILRANKGETMTSTVDNVEAVIVKNGKNPIKSFTQIHYIKGYFCLKHLSALIGVESFMLLLKCYIEKYGGQLVDSKALFQLFFEKYPEISKEYTIEQLFENWLHSPGIPHELQESIPSADNELYSSAIIQAQKLKSTNSRLLKKRRSKRRKISFTELLNTTSKRQVTPEQKILILEILLEEDQLAYDVLRFLQKEYCTYCENAEVRHRWCELIVKHEYKPGYPFLQSFITKDLAMGVYLYGEMIWSSSRALQALARDCYRTAKPEMEPSFVDTIGDMLASSGLA